MNPSYEIENIKSELFKKKMVLELQYFEEFKNQNVFMNIKEEDISERQNKINLLINMVNRNIESNNQKHKIVFDEIDKYSCKKKWNKINNYYKIIKLTEYLKANVEDVNMQNELIKKVSAFVEENKMNTQKYVTYDEKNEKIIALPCLIINPDEKTYSFKITK